MLTGHGACGILGVMKKTSFRLHRELLWFSAFAVVTGAYFLLQFLPLEHHAVHTALDDVIPFVPAFVIPYIVWYVYVPGLMLLTYAADRARFVRQAVTLFSGALLCVAIFALWPSRVDFRPDAAGDGVLLWLCRTIYSSDRPYNVFPSLHCYETTAVFLAAFCRGPLRQRKGLCAVSALIGAAICLSTLFIKQHSVLDLLSGCGLAAAVYAMTEAAFDRKNKKKVV